MQKLIKIFNDNINNDCSSEDLILDTLGKIAKKLKTQELWTVVSKVTTNYYSNYKDGQTVCYLFSEESFAKEYANFLKKNGSTVEVLKMEIETRLMMFSDLYRNGFEIISIDYGQNNFNFDLFDIIKKPDLSKIPEQDQLPNNPKLMRSINRFFQARETKVVTPEMEHNFMKELYKAKYLVPVNSIPGGGMTIVALKGHQGKNFTPLFTDFFEFTKFATNDKQQHIYANFEDIKGYILTDEIEGIVFNPFGFNLTVDRKTLNQIELIAKP